MCLRMIGLCCLLAYAAFAADPVPSVPQTKTDIDKKIAALTQRQVELSFILRDQIRDHETLWMNPQYTSEEITKLRKRMEALKVELTELQVKVRELVLDLPAVKAELEKVDIEKSEFQTNAKQIEELGKRRAQAP